MIRAAHVLIVSGSKQPCSINAWHPDLVMLRALPPHLEVVEVVAAHGLHTVINQAAQGALASAGEATLECTCSTSSASSDL